MQKSVNFSKICLIYFVSLFCFVAIRLTTALGVLNNLNEIASESIFTSVVQILVMGVLPFILFIVYFKKEKINKTSLKTSLSEIGFNKISLKTIIISLLLGVCAYVFNIVIASFFDVIISSLGYSGVSSGSVSSNTQVWYLFFSLFFTAVLPGIFEEILHRGILLNGLKQTKNYKWAIIFSGLFFGFMHLNINQFFYATIIGMFFAFIALITKSIWPSIIMHFVNNAINVYLSWASSSKSFGSNFFATLNNFLKNENFVIVVISSICFMAVLSIITIWLIIKLYNENNKDNKIYFRVFTSKHIKNFVALKKNTVEEQSLTSLNYNTYVSKDNELIPTEENMSSLFNLKEEKTDKFGFKYHIFFFAIILLGALTTLFTFIWGIL